MQENWSLVFLTSSDTSQPRRRLEARKFLILEEEELYYLRSKNKVADQLCSNCFRIIGKNPNPVFS